MQLSILAKKDQILLHKFVEAEEIRQEKKLIHTQIKEKYKSPKESLHENFDRIEALQQELREEWKKKENERLIRIKNKEIDKLQQKQLISQRVKRSLERQQAKIKRDVLPDGPKVDPLPYIKSFKEKMAKKLAQEEEEHLDQRELDTVGRPPMLLYIPNQGYTQVPVQSNNRGSATKSHSPNRPGPYYPNKNRLNFPGRLESGSPLGKRNEFNLANRKNSPAKSQYNPDFHQPGRGLNSPARSHYQDKTKAEFIHNPIKGVNTPGYANLPFIINEKRSHGSFSQNIEKLGEWIPGQSSSPRSRLKANHKSAQFETEYKQSSYKCDHLRRFRH